MKREEAMFLKRAWLKANVDDLALRTDEFGGQS